MPEQWPRVHVAFRSGDSAIDSCLRYLSHADEERHHPTVPTDVGIRRELGGGAALPFRRYSDGPSLDSRAAHETVAVAARAASGPSTF